jgi:thymidine kinase
MAKLYFIYAAMNAGKSTTLLQSAFNYEERGMRPALFTAAIDTRGGAGFITSRIGLTAPARAFDQATDLFAEVEALQRAGKVDCVFIDEAQFLTPGQVERAAHIVDQLSIPVLCYGLRTDFRGELFPGAHRLFALADEVRELKTICFCGRKATMNLRMNDAGEAVTHGETVMIGGNERYEALCRKHFLERMGVHPHAS